MDLIACSMKLAAFRVGDLCLMLGSEPIVVALAVDVEEEEDEEESTDDTYSQ